MARANWRGRGRGIAPQLRTQLFRAPDGGAKRCSHHAGARHRRLPVVQRLETGGQPGPEFWPLWSAQGRDPRLDAAICTRLRRRGHPGQRGQRRPHQERVVNPRDDRRSRRQRAVSAKPTISPAICSAAKSPPTMSRKPSSPTRWRSKPPPTSPPSTAATSPPPCADALALPAADLFQRSRPG